MSQQCVVCGTVSAALESHHVYPVCYGGDPDGYQVILCGRCHSAVHYTAEDLCSKKPKRKPYFTPDLLGLPMTKELVATVIRAKKSFDSSQHPTLKRKLHLEVPNQLLTDLHKCKTDSGFSNLGDYIIKVLIDHVNRRL